MTNVADNGSQDRSQEGATWWCKLFAKGVGVISAIVCAICGIFSLLSLLHPICIGSGVIMLFISFILFLFEAPVCCMFFESTKSVSTWIENRSYWQKGLFYVVISVVPVVMCVSVTTFIGCICPFATGVVYGLMSLGRKAGRNEMISNAGTAKFKQFENEA